MSVHTPVHPSVCISGKPIWNVTFSSWYGSLKHVFNLLIDIHIMVNWQLSSLGISWPESNECIAGSGANSSRSTVIMLSAAQLLAFNWLQAQVCVFHQLVLKSQWPSPKVNYRFVDFFAVVPSSLSEFINAETGASLLKLWRNLQDWYTLPYIPQQWLPVHHGQLFWSPLSLSYAAPAIDEYGPDYRCTINC